MQSFVKSKSGSQSSPNAVSNQLVHNMTFLQQFLIASLIVHTLIGMLWSTNSLLNIFIKFIFIALAVAAGVLLGTEFGFIVRG